MFRQSVTCSVCIFLILLLGGCDDEVAINGLERSAEQASPACLAQTFRFPTTRDDFQHVYANRGFYTDGRHLGRDIELAEGASIHPIACGVVRVYRAASGYGTLVVIIEHTLAESRVVKNGLGSPVTITKFLSIYGHLRSTSLINGGDQLAFREGDLVGPNDVVGYVQNDSLNGDGAEHLHLGIRLQNTVDAEATDASWFRGYDGEPSQREWFADPADFLDTLMTQGIPVRWHPAGTVLYKHQDIGDTWWLVGTNSSLQSLTAVTAKSERLTAQAIPASDEELHCYTQGPPYIRQLSNAHLLKFDDASTVYEYHDGVPPVRYAFISQAAFDSWGWNAQEISVRPNREREAFLTHYQDLGYRRLRDGTLVKGQGLSEVAVVSDGRRLPIFDWSTFLALGYQPTRIVETDPLTLDAVAYPRGPLITPEIASYCGHPVSCLGDDCHPGLGGGGIDEDLHVDTPDLATRLAETCNGKDDDDNGLVDDIFPCPLGKQGPICVTACGANGYRVCEAPACDWSVTCHPFAENCDNTIDDDCDGRIDCADTDCLAQPACQPKPDAGVNIDAARPPDLGVVSVPDMARGLMATRYEFRVTDGSWQADEPFNLFDSQWGAIVCKNTGTDKMEPIANDWHRCDVAQPVTPFVGNFFSKAHPNWGYQGHIATVGSFPKHCTPTSGIEWRLTDLGSGQTFFTGPAGNLNCITANNYDFHVLPPFP